MPLQPSPTYPLGRLRMAGAALSVPETRGLLITSPDGCSRIVRQVFARAGDRVACRAGRLHPREAAARRSV